MKILLLFVLFPAFVFAAKGQKGFVQISPEREIFVDWVYAKPGHPTVVLINGLTYSTLQWDRFSKALADEGFGVLRFDPMGMGETLKKYAPALVDIAIEDQVKDLRLLLKTLKVPKPYNLVGLSYGGGLGILYASMHPTEVGQLIAMAPYTEPMASQDQWIRSQIWYVRQTQPWNQASDEELYSYFFRQIVYTTYPSVEPVVLENPYKLEAIFRLGNGIRKFIANQVVGTLPPNSLHLIIAGKDQYIPRGVLEDFWSHVPKSARASKIILNNSEHKIPEATPHFSASLVKEILSKNPVFTKGREIQADPYSGEVTYEDGRFQLPEEF